MLAFPCQGGRFYDWENNGMPDAAAWLIQNGRIQLFCADSIDQDSFLAEGLSPAAGPKCRRSISATSPASWRPASWP